MKRVERYFTTREICEIFRVGRKQVYKWKNSGLLQMIKPGKSFISSESELARFASTVMEKGITSDEATCAIAMASQKTNMMA